MLKKILAKLVVKKDDTSASNSVDSTDLRKLGRTALFAGLAAVVTVLVNNAADLGFSPEITAILTGAGTLLLDLITKYKKDNTNKEE